MLGLVACGANTHVGASSSLRDVGRVESAERDSAEGIRQTDDLGRSLPFETEHPNRWNRGNDGTSYEPCTALTDARLSGLGVDPATVRDAAGTNGQTLRGCAWEYRDSVPSQGWSVSQIVGNWESLELDKQMKSTEYDVWRDDVVVNGRVIGVLTDPVAGDCVTYVQSGRAAVNTFVFNHSDSPDVDETCDRALEFTRATLDQMPE